MFERFTDRARKVVVTSQEEARLANHGLIGSEHLLLGLIRATEGISGRVLAECGLTLETARARVAAIQGLGEAPVSGHVPFTPRAKKILELSLREALSIGDNYIGTEHLLLGLLREEEGAGAQIIEQCVDGGAEAVRRALMRVIEQRGPVQAPPNEAMGALRPLPRAGDPVVARQPELDRLRAILARRRRNNAFLVGPRGAGKSALMRALAQTLKAPGHGPLAKSSVFVLEPAGVRRIAAWAGRERAGTVVLLDDLDAWLTVDGANTGPLMTTLLSLTDASVPFVVTGTQQARAALAGLNPVVSERFEEVELAPADAALTESVLRAYLGVLTEHHKVVIDEDALVLAVGLAAAAPGPSVLPGAALDLLDAAAARAAATGFAGAPGVLTVEILREQAAAG